MPSKIGKDLLQSYLADDPPTVVQLAIKPHFEALTDREKHYAHYLSIASWAGTRVCLRQVSPESEHIYDMIVELHRHCKGDWTSLAKDSGVSDEELTEFLNYAAQFLGNTGNFKSFGDSKFIPRISARQLKALASASPKALEAHEKAESSIYESDVGHMHLGYPDAGHVSNYYPDSPTLTKEDITQLSTTFEEEGLLPENTRVRKLPSGDFEILIASSQTHPGEDTRDLPDLKYELEGSLTGKTATLVFGDHKAEMQKIADGIREAHKYTANETQSKMMVQYFKSFETGSLEAFKESQREWVKDKSPNVESDIGFIENYRDPHGIRSEFEGFVAMVNKERTRAFSQLVEEAPKYIPKLPWSADFETDQFLSPDFTSLEVLSYAGSGIPAGINIPNYDDIRQNLGFKNVSLGNVMSAQAPNETIPFLPAADQKLYRKYRDPAFEVQVGLHELLGHGCGKLLQETSPGVFNFNKDSPPISPITNEPITTWYKPGQTWSSVFGALGKSYEECRAECVAMFLCCDFSILKIFGFGDGSPDMENEAGDVMYTAYLSMARAGIAALEFWDPASRKWGQGHMQARYSILRTMLDAGDGFAELVYSKEADETSVKDLEIHIDRSKIISHGRPAMEKYLQRLHIFKATADFAEGKKMYEELTNVDSFWAEEVRPEVLRRKVPRKVYVQANTLVEYGEVVLKEYEPTVEGMIRSYAEREYI
ncbi:MAG: hypothetical protein M1828_002725 [Chrysothrix sp. TS-e1954]|nr:MAG: hypothetical protein M1828_002725 [Chrysothrix sp. TS-e1954]